MSLKRETPCDFGPCPYEAEYSHDCEWWCGAEEPQDTIDEEFYSDEDEPKLDHYAGVPDGAVIEFPSSASFYMKVGNRNGTGGVINLDNGEFLTKEDLEKDRLGVLCHVVGTRLIDFCAINE